MAPGGNNIFPRSLSVNAKEVSEIFLITLLIPDKLAQMYIRSYIYITSRVKGSHNFCVQNGPKKIFHGKTMFNKKKYFWCSSLPFPGEKVDIGLKLTLGQSQTIQRSIKSTFIFSLCQEQPLGSWLNFTNSFRTTLV